MSEEKAKNQSIVLRVDTHFFRHQRLREIPKFVGAVLVVLVLFLFVDDAFPLNEKIMIVIVISVFLLGILSFAWKQGEKALAASYIQFQINKLSIRLEGQNYEISRNDLEHFSLIDKSKSLFWILRSNLQDYPDIKIRKRAFPEFLEYYSRYAASKKAS